MSSSVAKQCRHLRNAEDRFLNPPNMLLAGLSAHTDVSVPLMFRSTPSIVNGTPLSYVHMWYISYIRYDYNLTDSSFITLSTNGSKMVFKPYLFIKRDSTTASNSIHFNLDRSAGVIFPRVK